MVSFVMYGEPVGAVYDFSAPTPVRKSVAAPRPMRKHATLGEALRSQIGKIPQVRGTFQLHDPGGTEVIGACALGAMGLAAGLNMYDNPHRVHQSTLYPEIAMEAPAPYECDLCRELGAPHTHSVMGTVNQHIIHLNDREGWSFEQIADWLDTLDYSRFDPTRLMQAEPEPEPAISDAEFDALIAEIKADLEEGEPVPEATLVSLPRSAFDRLLEMEGMEYIIEPQPEGGQFQDETRVLELPVRVKERALVPLLE